MEEGGPSTSTTSASSINSKKGHAATTEEGNAATVEEGQETKEIEGGSKLHFNSNMLSDAML